MQVKHQLQDLLEPVIEGLGYEMVRIMTIGQKNPTLQIMIDRKDGKDITVDDCATVSRKISEVMDEKDPINDQYSLEVSSPGLGRPLKKDRDFERSLGESVEVRLYRAMPLACVPSFAACGLRLFVANDYLTQKHKAYKIK